MTARPTDAPGRGPPALPLVIFLLATRLVAGPTVAAQETAPAPASDRLPILQPPRVRYHPQGLEQQEGFVLLQFVVDPAGRVDTSTIQVVRASDGRYIEAALLMAAGSSYTPGVERGRPVRIMIQQLFRFEAGGTRCEQVVAPVRHPQCVDSVISSP